MAPVSPDFPEPFSEVLTQLQGVLGLLRDHAASMAAVGPALAEDLSPESAGPAAGADAVGTEDTQAADPTLVSSTASSRLRPAAQDGDDVVIEVVNQDVIQAALRRCAQALEACGRAPLALLVHGCELALPSLEPAHARHTPEAAVVIEQALLAVLQQADRPVPDELALVAELFPFYQAVQQLAGVDRAHPADLWPGRHPLLDLPSDPFAVPRGLDEEARLALEEALLKTLKQPGAEAFRAMSDLCTALGEGAAPVQADLWKLAGAVYEAQADERLPPDVYLKRLGPRLLSLARATLRAEAPMAAQASAQASARQLGHELLFRCHCALAAPGPAGPRLERVALACGVTLTPVAPVTPAAAVTSVTSDAPEAPEAPEALPGPALDAVAGLPARPSGLRSLAEAVPGLPSAADLDLAGWGLAANADRVVTPDDEIKVIGPLRLEIPVFNAFLNDADEASRRLSMVLAEWADAAQLPVPSEAAVQAFALAQGAERVGHETLAGLARQLVRVLRACATLPGPAAVAAAPGRAAQHLTAAAEEMRRVLHQFAAGFLTEPSAVVLARLDDCLADPLPSGSPGHLAAGSGAPER